MLLQNITLVIAQTYVVYAAASFILSLTLHIAHVQ